MTNAADPLVSSRSTNALARQIAASATTESPGRLAVLCRAHAVRDVGLLEDALVDLLAIPGTTATTCVAIGGMTPTAAASTAPARLSGLPTSANGASSMHLRSLAVDPTPSASVVLEVLEPPKVPNLYF